MSNDDLLMKEFLIESYEGMSNIKSSLLDLEKNPNNLDQINFIFRVIHTLKGSASFLGLSNLKSLSHAIESLLDLLRNSKLIFDQDIYEILAESFDTVSAMLKVIEDTKTEASFDASMITTKLNLFLELPQQNPSPISVTQVSTPVEVPATKADVVEAPKIESNKEEISEVKIETVVSPIQAEEVKTVMPEVAAAPSMMMNKEIDGGDGEAKKTTSVTDSIVKVNVKLLDQIMNMIGELVVNRNQILQYTSKNDDFELQKLTHQLDVITSDLQNEIMATRMQPVGQVLNKFERVVRDLAKAQGKKVLLTISGQETELDKTLIEAIKDPLTHLIRNAVDHGIETPDIRLKANKNETASLRLMAVHENGKVSIKIQDDGKGIDPQKIKEKAIEKGIITKEFAEKMSVKEIVSLIFAPGFSTAEKITDISGRGVGMDVVKTNIEKIGGEIDIQTQVGSGTTFTLKIPLTLAIIPSLVVYAGTRPYCIPQLNIVEFVLLDKNQNGNKLHQMHGISFFNLREKLIPIYSLSTILKNESNANSNEAIEKLEYLHIVVVNGDGQEYGLVVDTILDIEEIVVKPLSRNLKSIEYYSGATVMGNGEIALILETSSIIKKINPNRVKNETKKEDRARELINGLDNTREFLIFTLRDEKKYALSLSFIDRIEEFNNFDINFSGNKLFVKYREQVVPLIDIQYNIDAKMHLTKFESKVQVLIIDVRGHLIGLIVNQVFDAQAIMNDIDEFANIHPMLSGTVFVDEHPVLVLNLTNLLKDLNISVENNKNIRTLFHVDDSKMHRGILKDIILSEFSDTFNFRQFEDGVQFLNYLNKNKDDILPGSIIISDIDMPHMNGWELIKEINNYFKDKEFKILTLTSRDHSEDKERTKELNVLYHLKKFNKTDIVDAIKYYLNNNNALVKETKLHNVSATVNQFCGFKIGHESYAIPIENVQEIVKAQIVSPVPKSPNEIKGLINLRGQIVTSIWLGDVFKYDHNFTNEHMNIIVRNKEGTVSLMVDEILDVMDFDHQEKDIVPDNIRSDVRKYFHCVYKKPNDLVTIVNVDTLLDDVF